MLTLILKGTNGCNLNCAYCSLGEKPNHDIVSEQMLDRIFEYTCKLCQIRNESHLEIILHGGEPTLVPISTYESAIEKCKKNFPNIQINISMQTNAVCITEAYLDFIKRYNINVGVSIDGSADIHNQERKSKSGYGTYTNVIKNIERMQAEGINVSALMVLTSIGVASTLEFLDYFASRNICLKINPLLNYGEAYKNPELALKKGDYAKYLIRVYEYVINNKLEVTISPIDKLLQAIISNSHIGECTFNANCNKGFLCIDHKGDIYPCGKYSDIHEFKLGNVGSSTGDITGCLKYQQLIKRRNCNVPARCKKCKYIELCHAGCNAEASIEKKFGEPPFLCEDYQLLFNYFSSKGLLLLRNQLVEAKERLMEEIDGI